MIAPVFRSAAVRRVAALVLTTLAATTLGRGPAPALAAALPAGMRALPVTGDGHVCIGASGAGSPADLLRASLRTAHALFGAAPTVVGASRSTDGTLTVALFRVTAGGTALGGLVLATYVAGGRSQTAIAYDRADRFGTSAPALIARVVAAETPAAAAVPPMHDIVAPDGSVRARLPAGWTTRIFAGGVFAAAAPDTAEVDQEVAARLIDPRSPVFQQALQLQQQLHQPLNPMATPYGIPMTYQPDPARAFVALSDALATFGHQGNPNIVIERTIAQPAQPGIRAVEIAGTDTVKGVPTRFDGIVGITPMTSTGAWMLSVKMISAPVAHFQADLPALAAVYNSYTVDQRVMGDQVAQTIAADRAGMARGLAMAQATQSRDAAVFDASMSHARSVQDGIDRSTAGFTRYLSDTTVLQASDGDRGTVGASFAQSVVANDPQHFRVVPVSEYRAGVDY
jgi:hypothetical protein